MTTQQRIRVLGVDTPERGQDGWAEATMFTSQWCEALKGRLRITTQKADSFGRYLGVIYDPSTFLGLGQALIDSGHAKVYAR
jgi:micrococcal nuclease